MAVVDAAIELIEGPVESYRRRLCNMPLHNQAGHVPPYHRIRLQRLDHLIPNIPAHVWPDPLLRSAVMCDPGSNLRCVRKAQAFAV